MDYQKTRDKKNMLPIKPIISVQTKQKTSVYNIVSLGVGITAVVAVFIVIGTVIMSGLPVVPVLITTGLDDSTTTVLTWTAPGDDGAVGQATGYDLRYLKETITDSNWSQATRVTGLGVPKPAGSQETFIVRNLTPATNYFFAIKSVDENDNWSPISNVASHTTDCNPDWSCTEWSLCVDSNQLRQCTDNNICGDLSSRPTVSRSCQEVPVDLPEDPDEEPAEDELVVPDETPVEEAEEREVVVEPIGGCLPDWQCSTWSACRDNKVYRQCIDVNLCGTIIDQPDLSRSCSAEVCNEKWACNDWSDCQASTRRRNCVDENKCGTADLKPLTVTGCALTKPRPPQESVIVTGTAAGGGPQVRIFDRDQKLVSQFFAYDPRFKNGITVAAGDVDGDGHIEIVTGTGPNSAPHVRIFDLYGNLEGQFYAYPNFFQIGVDIAVADVNGDGRDEIITGPLGNGGPHVKIFTLQNGNYQVIGEFFAYASFFRGGVSVTAGDLNNDGRAEIVTAPYSKGGPHIRVFKYQAGKVSLSSQFFAFPAEWRMGLDVSIVRYKSPYEPRIVVAAGPGGG
ncbi:MAG: FG-GAP-like repeat-containing protein, partial [Patescibacteria group bacterium]